MLKTQIHSQKTLQKIQVHLPKKWIKKISRTIHLHSPKIIQKIQVPLPKIWMRKISQRIQMHLPRTIQMPMEAMIQMLLGQIIKRAGDGQEMMKKLVP